MKKKVIGVLIIVLVMIVSAGCGEKTYEELVQEATYGGTGEMKKSEPVPAYEPPSQGHLETSEQESEILEMTRDDLEQY